MKANFKTLPVALTVAGSDSGGGAGIQADLKAFAALGVHGTSAITCVTAQNPRRVSGIQAIKPEMVRAQIEAVFAELKPAAVKTGMLFSAEIIREVGDFFATRRPPLVIDPVMVATSGAVLLKPSAIRDLKARLLPLATVITPNVDEAVLLWGHAIMTREDLHVAARELQGQFGCAVLVKGGHLKNLEEAVDVLFDGRKPMEFVSPRTKGVSTHGTGCTYSAAIAAGLAKGLALPKAVAEAKRYISRSIAGSYKAGRHFVLNHGK